MDKEEVLAMEAGVDLDAVVARDVMQLAYPMIDLNQAYSTDIWAAWQVVERLEWHEFRIHNEYRNGKWYWYCGIEQPEDLGEGYFSAQAERLPEAICKAALLAKPEVKNV